MTNERKIEILSFVVFRLLRKKELSFEDFRRELGRLSKMSGFKLEEFKIVLQPVFIEMTEELFAEKESQGSAEAV